jgi:CBS domain containing-hemolysin-like protein
LLLLHAFFAAAKESITSLRKARRLQLIDERKPAAPKIDALAENPILTVTTEQVALKLLSSLIVVIAIFSYTTPVAQAIQLNNFITATIITILVILIILIFAELIPKQVAQKYAEPIALWTTYPFATLTYLVAPLLQISAVISRIITGRWNESDDHYPTTITEEDLLSYVDAGQEEGLLKEDEKEMIYSIFDLDDTLAREIMVPRIDMVALETHTSIGEAIRVAIEAGHSRVPVYTDSIDNIVGILYVKDLLGYWHSQTPPSSIKGLERGVYFVPETKSVSELLRELQSKKVHIAIVVDEYGGTAGLVTIEDILEEIVGEIQDEHDADEFYMQYISDNEYIFSARMDLDDINNLMSLELPTDESDTLGGLIYTMLGRIPSPGDSLDGASIDNPDILLTVLEVEGRRIKAVKIKRIIKPTSDAIKKEYKSSLADQNASNLINNSRKPLSESS